MKKTILLTVFALFAATVTAADQLEGLNTQLLKIKAETSAETIGIVFNPATVNLTNRNVSVKTLALPATNGPVLIQNLKTIIKKVDALYLIKGDKVTAEKLAKYIVKNAAKYNVRVYSNDEKLAGVAGLTLIRKNADGAFTFESAAK